MCISYSPSLFSNYLFINESRIQMAVSVLIVAEALTYSILFTNYNDIFRLISV